MNARTAGALLLALALVIAACSSTGSGEAGGNASTVPEGELPPEIAAQIAVTPVPDTDIALPDDIPSTPAGAPGYSHFVFQYFDGEIVPTMVEGPREGTVRCQTEDLPCSYVELVELYESGEDIPPELEMDETTLEELVGQFEELRTALERYEDPSAACEDGFRGQPVQVPNMGSHWWNIPRITDGVFDPSEPEIVLYGVADNADPGATFSEGECTEDGWTGERDLVVLGASFILPPEQFGLDHPDGFAGDLDNWHVHYNLCNTFIPVPDKAACDELGGSFAETTGWMNHVWVNPDFDNPLGAFTMWNASIYPVSDPDDVRQRFDENPDDEAYRSIENFDYGRDLTVAPGEEILWANTDAVPHTITSDDGIFDTGVFGPGVVEPLSIEDEGEYTFFCSLHPGMTGSITVEG